MIDPRAIIDPAARIGEGVSIGPWTTIGADVVVGAGCEISSHVVVRGPTVLGARNRIFQFATIGEDTPALAYRGEPTTLTIGDDNVFREGVTVHRGMTLASGGTRIGSHGLFMAYVHIGHDCVVGDHVIMANNASVSGHVVVGDHANFGGYAGVPQFRRIGPYTHVAGMSLVLKDVPAFVTVAGNPATANGMNVEGMRRRGLDPEAIAALRMAYRITFLRGMRVAEATAALAESAARHPEVALFVDSLAGSRWGIIRPRGSAADADGP